MAFELVKGTRVFTDPAITTLSSVVLDNALAELSGGAGTAVWGGITGTLANQVDLQNALDAKVNDTGDESIGGEKNFTTGIKISSSALLSSVVTGTSDNDKIPTKGYVDDQIGGENLWDRVTGPTNYLIPHTATDELGATGARIVNGWFDAININDLEIKNVASNIQFNFGSSIGATYFNLNKDDVDFFVRGTTDNNLLKVDAGNNRVHVGPPIGSTKFSVNGGMNLATGFNYKINNEQVLNETTLTLNNTTTPSTISGKSRVYGKSDNLIYSKDGGGTERILSSGRELLEVRTFSTSGNEVFTNLDDGYTHVFLIDEIFFSGSGVYLQANISRDGGSTFVTTAFYHYRITSMISSGTTKDEVNANNSTSLLIISNTPGWGGNNLVGEIYNGELTCYNPSSSSRFKQFLFNSVYGSPNAVINQGGGAIRDSQSAYDAIKFSANSGNITGKIKHYRYL